MSRVSLILVYLGFGTPGSVGWEGWDRVTVLMVVQGSGGKGVGGPRQPFEAGEGTGWKQAGPALSLCPLCAAGTSSSRVSAVLCSSRTFLLAAFSIVEYPLQLLHSPPAPAVKRPGAMATHHPLQVLSSSLAWGSLPRWDGWLLPCLFWVCLSPLSLCGGLLWCLTL